jgi:hypothetical protein
MNPFAHPLAWHRRRLLAGVSLNAMARATEDGIRAGMEAKRKARIEAARSAAGRKGDPGSSQRSRPVLEGEPSRLVARPAGGQPPSGGEQPLRPE